MSEERLDGGGRTDVHRRGSVVLRPAQPWSRTVVALLRHLEDCGYPGSPRVVGDGFDADGREALAYVPGSVPSFPWSEDGAFRLGALLRSLHAATASFVPPPGAVWRPWFGRDLPVSDPVIGHGDTAPWNVLARDGVPVAFVDWETAGPFDRMWELAHTAWLNAWLYDDDVASRDGLPDLAARSTVLRALVDGYELPSAARAELVDRMVEFAVFSARADAIEGRVGPSSVHVADEHGWHPLWGITWKVRSAAWMIEHRANLRSALT